VTHNWKKAVLDGQLSNYSAALKLKLNDANLRETIINTESIVQYYDEIVSCITSAADTTLAKVRYKYKPY